VKMVTLCSPIDLIRAFAASIMLLQLIRKYG
jgi:hypothetical protein